MIHNSFNAFGTIAFFSCRNGLGYVELQVDDGSMSAAATLTDGIRHAVADVNSLSLAR